MKENRGRREKEREKRKREREKALRKEKNHSGIQRSIDTETQDCPGA